MTKRDRIDGKWSEASKRGDDIEIAPMYETRMDKIVQEEVAIRRLHGNVLEYLKGALADLEKRRREFWIDLSDDLGLDSKVTYTLQGRILTKAPETSADKPASPK